MKKFTLLMVWSAFFAAEVVDSMAVRDGKAFSDLMLFPRSVQDGDGESARLFKDVVSSSFVVSGFRETEVDELCAEATRVLPVRLTMKAMRDVLGKACPNGVFSKFSDSNFSFLGRVFPSVYDMGRYRIGSAVDVLKCMVGGIRVVADRLHLNIDKESINSFLLRNSVDQSLIDGIGDAVQDSFMVDSGVCIKTVRRLFPEGMFYNFNKIKAWFITHMYPQSKHIWSSRLSESDSVFFAECLVGVVRTLFSKHYRADAETCKELLQSYLAVPSGNDGSLLSKKKGIVLAADCRVLASQLVRSSYIAVGLVPGFTSKLVLPGIVSENELGELREAFAMSNYSGSVALKADLAFRIWNHLAPEGMFHLFSPQEVMMLNLMHPIGLTQKQRLVWMEWLVGAYRSFVIRENVENPVPYFKRAVSLKERGSEEESSEGVVHRTEWHVPQ